VRVPCWLLLGLAACSQGGGTGPQIGPFPDPGHIPWIQVTTPPCNSGGQAGCEGACCATDQDCGALPGCVGQAVGEAQSCVGSPTPALYVQCTQGVCLTSASRCDGGS
jgi:hypothetical protein